ncbi:MAG: CRISPR-associated protein Csx3 [Oculatellaceae cyanobacterium Prado106]|nr:CRISPR-associated protein Csx3 [Oculatellaceae cyanobacterium Prado106]
MSQIFSQIELRIVPIKDGDLRYQLLTITILRPGDLFVEREGSRGKSLLARIQPEELEQLRLPEAWDESRGVMLFGNAPTWLYGRLVALCRGAAWVGCYNVRQGGAIVVASRVPFPDVGAVVPLRSRPQPGMAIAIGGAPNSGKSVFAHALRSALSQQMSSYLHRANWDGEGNWSYETEDQTVARQLVERGKFKIHLRPNGEALLQSYFEYHAEATRHIRAVVDVTLVDLGGRPDAVKLPVVSACSHFVIISRDAEQVPLWLELFRGLQPLVVIHSQLAEGCRVVRSQPILEVEAGPWLREREATVPMMVLERILKACEGSDKPSTTMRSPKDHL